MMERRLRSIVVLLVTVVLWGCDVHEWPTPPETAAVRLELDCQRMMQLWEHTYEGGDIVEQGITDEYDNAMESGTISYVVRIYPAEAATRSVSHLAEYRFERDLGEGYPFATTLELASGDYDVAVWAELRGEEEPARYNASDFGRVAIAQDRRGCDDYCDAFCGVARTSVRTSIVERAPDTLRMMLERPLSKFEIIATDIEKFIEREVRRRSLLQSVRAEDYDVVFHYVGYMPNCYNILDDTTSGATTNARVESSLTMWGGDEASLGFDYLFTYNVQSSVSLMVGIYDKASGEQLSLSPQIDVPLRRSHHTIIRGELLTLDAEGGVGIDPGYAGDHNIVIP